MFRGSAVYSSIISSFSGPVLGPLFISGRWWVPGDATSTAAGWGPTGVPAFGCIMHVLHLKATRTSGLCEGSKPSPVCKARCASSFTSTDPGRVGTTQTVATEHQIRKRQWPHLVQGAVQKRLKLMKKIERLPGQQGPQDLVLDHFKLGRGLFSGNTIHRLTIEKDGKNLH